MSFCHAEIGLTGTKLGCGEGGCGACTVMLSSMENGELHHRSANACLCPLYSVDGMHVVTVEGRSHLDSVDHADLSTLYPSSIQAVQLLYDKF